ncbi:hypothetical protein [Priestia taiwanensis]|uniref:hypothetical protein n=1 Tax=Priestia taiwanensis TaxID=1347902 RepID=UPI00166A52DE|nr:hypothetical protein [Priestia taiwanensis]MBM7363177.1 hypothetical protein [Priestia taiwanensis]
MISYLNDLQLSLTEITCSKGDTSARKERHKYFCGRLYVGTKRIIVEGNKERKKARTCFILKN